MKTISKTLIRYKDSEFSIQQSVRFFMILLLCLSGLMFLLLIYTGYLQLNDKIYGKLYVPILLPEISGLIIVFLCYLLLKKGYFSFSAHVFLITTFISIWIGVWLDKGNLVQRFDTVAFVMAILTMVPVFLNKNRGIIFIYVFANCIVLAVFLLLLKTKLNIPQTTLIDILADYSISIAFIGIVGYSISRINKKIYEKAVSDFNEKLKIERALKESEERYKALMESMNEIIIVTDNELKVEFVNQQFTQKLGYSKEEITGKIGYKLLHDPEDLKLAENSNRMRMNEKNGVYEMKCKAKNGTKYDFLVNSAAYKNSDGITIGSIKALTDITERKKIEQNLIESEYRYRNLFENAQIGIYQTTPEGKILNGNPAIFNMVGFNSIEDFENKNLESGELMKVDAREKFKHHIEQEGFVKNFETEWKNKNGETIYVIENSKAVKDKDGKTLYYDGFVENITERKKSEIELKESEQRYRAIIEAFPDILMISDLTGKIVFMNDVGQKITGISPKTYNKPSEIANIHPDDIETVVNATKELLLSDKEHTKIIENRFIDAWNNILWFSGIISKITVNGQPMLQTISRDITEKKEIELELENYRTHLERLVKDRTEELSSINEELKTSNEELTIKRETLETTLNDLKQTQNQLIQSEKMASLGIMAAGVAHEINNPLNFINGGIIGIQKWMKLNLPTQINELDPLFQGINEGIRRATTIVTGLNRYSRNDNTSFNACDIHSIMDSCLLMLNYQIKDRINVKKEYSDEKFSIFGNDGRLHQAILNILMNSVQAIQDTGNIAISTKIIKHELEIVIKDTGDGIKNENLQKIMDPFFTTKDPGKGIGLGLSITYTIIKQHNGSIQVESESGKGTKTIIKLPLNSN